MANIEEILNRQINSVKDLKTAIKELQDSLVGVDAESEEYKATSQQLAAAQDELNKVTRAGKDENIAAKDSIAGMEKEYRNLYNTYKMLSEEQRNSDFGKNMASSLETLSTKLNDSKKEVGNFKDNIGRYSESVVDAFGKMGISLGGLKGPLQVASNGTKGLGKAFKALAANPLMLALTALVAIFMKVVEAIKKNEELTDRLKQAFSVFQPVLDAISNAFDFLAGILVKVVEGVAKVSEKVLNLIPGYEKLSKKTKQLAKDQDELNKKMREGEVAISEKEKDVALLRDEASVEDDLVKKKQKLEEAQRLENEAYADKIALEEENLRIMKENAELTANSEEDNNKIAAQQATINRLYREQALAMKRANKELKSLTNSHEEGSNAASSSIKEEREEVEKLTKELIEYYKTDEEKLTERYNRERKLMEKYGQDTSLLTQKYSKDRLEIIINDVKKETDLINKYLENTNDNINRFYANLKSLHTNETDRFLIEAERLTELKGLVEQNEGRINKIIEDAAKLDSEEAARKLKELGKQTASAKELSSDFTKILNMWEYIFNKADLSKISDLQYITDFLSVFPEDASKITLLGDGQISPDSFFGNPDDIINGFKILMKEVGEEGWITLTSEIADGVKRLNNLGINIKNLPDFKARIADLGNEAAKAFGDAFKSNIEEVIKDTNEASMQLELDMLKNTDTDNYVKLFRDLGKLMAENTYDTLTAQKVAYEEELLSFSGTQEQKLEIMYKYYDVVKQMQENNLRLQELNRQRTEEMFESLIDLSDRIGSAMSTYRSSQEALIDSQVKIGEIDEAEAKKRKKRLLDLQKVETAFNIATIVADAASGLFSIWKGYAMEVGTVNPQTAAATGPAAAGTLAALNAKSLVTAIAKSAGLAATATAQVAAARGGYISAKNNLAAESSGGGSGSGSGSGVAASPVLIDSTPYTYTRTFQTEQEEEMNNRPVWVSVVDVENALGQQAVVKQESSW